LEIFDGNRRKASETLGISERTLYRKLDQFGLEKK
jgi:DNA-binding NtrC family response regulator